jgi:cytidine deaminase
MPTPAPAELHALAEAARDGAHAPYSGFAVGAALVTDTDEVFTGANIENASLTLSICAERVAVFRAIAAGHRRIAAIAVAGPAADVPPCGACRQVLAEFGDDDLLVSFPLGGELVTRTLGELLPAAFRLAPAPSSP